MLPKLLPCTAVDAYTVDRNRGEYFFDRLDQDGQNLRVPTCDAYEAGRKVQPGLAGATPGLAIAETPRIFIK
ncbi:MAG: hypothetical protein ACLPLP_03890 [Mycobacterium sp.]